jgi:DNA invertase Pin-like site-specific DNA recombinase
MKKATQKTAVVYIRTATTNEEAVNSQQKATKAKAQELSANIVSEFVDNGVSGKSIERQGLSGLLDYIVNNKADYVLMKDIARLSRDILATRKLIEQIERNGAQIEFVDDYDKKWLKTSGIPV